MSASRPLRIILLASISAAALMAAPALGQTVGSGEIAKPAPTQGSRTTSYDAGYFSQYAPRSAYDIVQRIPGFTLDLGATDNGADVRGFAGVAGNVVLNGQRPSTKSESLQTLLQHIPASRVVRVDVGPGDLYGADYSSKTQVASLILKDGGGIAGNAAVQATRHWLGVVTPTASASVSFSRGPSTFNLAADAGRNDYYEKGFDRIADYATGALLETRFKRNNIYQRDPYLSGSWALEGDDYRSAHVNARFAPSTFKLPQRNHVIPVGDIERNDTLIEDYKRRVFELGGDITRPLAGGGIKLVALANRQHRVDLDRYLVRDLSGTTIFGGSEDLTKAQRNETIGRLSWSRQSLWGMRVETGGELALNTLDYRFNLFDLDGAGHKIKEDLPIENATVEEKRGEIWVNTGRPITKHVRLDAGLNYEFSKLKVRGDALADRSLRFLKPSVTLDWQMPDHWHSQFILRRTVAQLDFYDFVSSAELSSGRVNGGNADLQPQRTWEGRLLVERPILGEGKLRVELGYDKVSMLQDRILVFDDSGKGFDAPGNLGTGTRRFVDVSVDTPLNRIWKGFRIRVHGQLQRTRVDDPISGDPRDWSGFYPRWAWDLDLRRDAGKVAYGLSISDRARTTFFRTDEFDRNFNVGLPYGSAFVEYRPSPKQTLTLNVEDITDTGGARDRLLFDPNRTEPAPAFHEYRFRNSHARVSITFKQSFGASGVAK
jgi:hypothetical protein